MSALMKLGITFTSTECVLAALNEAGFRRVRHHAEGALMQDYEVDHMGGKSRVRAEVIVPREENGLLSDIGFERTDGALSMVISDTDQAYAFPKQLHGKNWDDSLGLFQQMYAKHYTLSQAEGYDTNVEKQGDDVVITLSRWA